MFPATCPACGEPVTAALYSDPSVPVYGCGYSGRAHQLALKEAGMIQAGRAAAMFEPANVVPLDLDDALDLILVAGAAALSCDVRVVPVRPVR